MNLILFAAVITIATAGQLPSRSYIPQGQGQGPGNQGSGGFGAHGGSGGFGNQGGSGFGGQGGSGGFGGQGGSGGFGGHGGSGNFGGSQGGFGGSSQGQHGGSAGGYHQGSQNGGYGGSGGFGGNGNGNRPQQSQEKNAAVLKQDQAIDESGSYHFGYETENGIRAEEAGNPADAQGGFSYKGDDGHTYTITYTAGEGGFRPQGEHLPIAPPTPQAILEALQKNAQDEAAGIFDDGFYKGEGANAGHSGGYNSNRPGQTRPSFGNSGNHQNGFNPNSGYTY